MYYLVSLSDGEVAQILICKNEREIANLLLALKKEYKLISVTPLAEMVHTDYKDFVEIDKNIEFGKEV